MSRLFGVIAITLIAFYVATVFWNRAPHFDCSVEGLTQAAATFEALAERRPQRAEVELRKLSNRTRSDLEEAGIHDLLTDWTRQGDPNPRDCRRLRESLARL